MRDRPIKKDGIETSMGPIGTRENVRSTDPFAWLINSFTQMNAVARRG